VVVGLGAVLHVRDGDTVTLTYHEARDAAGLPRQHEISRTWYARTRMVDFRQVGLVDAGAGAATLHGARGAAPAGSLVRLFESLTADDAIATATADSAGGFRLDVESVALPETVALTAQETGLPESARLGVSRSRVTGQVVLPDTGMPVESALVEIRPEGEPGFCDGVPNCQPGSFLTDRDGRFYAHRGNAGFAGTVGGYELYPHPQGVPEYAPWFPAAYASSGPFSIVLDDGTASHDAGVLPLTGPHLFGDVHDTAGMPVVEAMIDVYGPNGELVRDTYTRADGAFALRLADGEYQLRVRGPFGCLGYADVYRPVSVHNGVPTPSTVSVVLDVVHVDTGGWALPLDPPANGVVVRLDAAGLTLRLSGTSGPGTLSVRCRTPGWDGVQAITPPVEIDWTGAFDEANVCLRYQPERAEHAGLAPDQLELLHRGDDGTLTALPLRPSTGEPELCGVTDSFSSFAVGAGSPPEPEPPVTPRARSTDDSCPPHVPEDGFTDLPEGAVHEAAVDCVVWWRVAQGRTAKSYAPAGDVTRGQMATFVANMVTASGGTLPVPRSDHFDDDDGHPHESSINRLAEAGIVSGRGDRSFGPNQPVGRGQMATFLVQTTEYRTGTDLPRDGDFFTDDDGTTHEARIDQAATAGFTGGGADGDYAPARAVRRDQMGSFLARVLDLLVEQHGARLP
jgi:hypothetical protein